MKKLLLLASISSILSITTLMAQDKDPWVGTWTGVFRVFTDGDNTTNRPYVKIKKYGNKYVVQVKEVYTYNDESTKTYYWDKCYDVNVSGNSIHWRSFSHQVDDWSGSAKSNGKIIADAQYYKVCTATLNDGILQFSEKIEGEFFDRKGNKIGEYLQPAFPTKDLYKDDDNW